MIYYYYCYYFYFNFFWVLLSLIDHWKVFGTCSILESLWNGDCTLWFPLGKELAQPSPNRHFVVWSSFLYLLQFLHATTMWSLSHCSRQSFSSHISSFYFSVDPTFKEFRGFESSDGHQITISGWPAPNFATQQFNVFICVLVNFYLCRMLVKALYNNMVNDIVRLDSQLPSIDKVYDSMHNNNNKRKNLLQSTLGNKKKCWLLSWQCLQDWSKITIS